MNRTVLVVQPDRSASDELSRIFNEWGDEVHLASSLKTASNQIKINLPDLIVFDISLFGAKWPQSIHNLKERFQKTNLLFTYSSKTSLPKSYFSELIKWQVITLPITGDRLSLALEGNLSKFDILEPIQKKARLTYPIRFQISWPYLILSLFFTLVVTYITTQIVFDSAEERFSNQLIEAGKLSSEWMVLEEERLLETLRLVVNTTGLSEAVEEGDINSIHRFIYPIAVNAQEAYIEILNTNGTTVYSLRHQPGGRIEDYDTSTGGDYFSTLNIVITILDGESDRYGDKYAGLANPPWEKSFYVAGPLIQGDSIVGVVLVGKSLSSLVQEMRETTLAQTTVYDFNGQTLATTFLSNQSLDQELLSEILPNQDTYSLTNNISLAELDYTEILGPWEIRNDDDIGILGAALPQNYLVHTSWITRTQIFIALGVFISLILIIGYRLANRISKPLESLAEASEKIATGDYMVTLDSPGSNEVAMLTKSFNFMIKNLEKSQTELLEAYDSSLEGWSRALSLRDHDTDEHSRRVVVTTLEIAKIMGFSSADLESIRRGAMLHDIGKVGIPDDILRKPGPLSPEEWVIMKKHPLLAIELLQPISFLEKSLEIPLYHHERWDGTGYPYGLKGEKIPLSSRIFTVADVYDALVSKRPYRDAWSRHQALTYIINNRGSHFDPEIANLFLELNTGKKIPE